MERFLEEVPNASLAFMCTFNALSVVGYKELLEWIVSLRRRFHKPGRNIFLDIPHLKYPDFMAVQILPKEYRSYMVDHIKFMNEHLDEVYGIKAAEVLKMQRILSWMEEADDWGASEASKLALNRKNFVLFFKEHDRRRGTDFLKCFPEMESFFNEY